MHCSLSTKHVIDNTTHMQVRAPSIDTSDGYNSTTDANSTPGITVEDNISTEEHSSEYTCQALSLLAEVSEDSVLHSNRIHFETISLITSTNARRKTIYI